MFRRRAAARDAEQEIAATEDALAPDDDGQDSSAPESIDDGVADGAAQPAPDAAAAAPFDRSSGPWDASEVSDPSEQGRLDLGAIWLPGRPGMELRVEIDQETQEVAAVAVIIGEAALQVQPFAAPRTAGEWAGIRAEIAAGLAEQGGQSEDAEGPFGTELRALVPVQLPDGTPAVQQVRFTGVDGPRWFLRGVFSGAAAVDAQAAAPLEDIFRDVVVVRGSEAMAPREPIPLRLPADALAAGDAVPEPEDADMLNPFERGPEITETR